MIAISLGLLALLGPAAAALVLAWRASPRARQRLAAAPAAMGIALGLAAVLWSALLFGGIRSRALLVAFDLAAWGGLAIVALRLRPSDSDHSEPPVAPSGRAATASAAALLIAVGALAAVSFIAASAVWPHGEWDAWAQWNLRARFLFRGLDDGTWRVAFDPILAWSHPDYPPLIPAAVARLWTFAGRETLLAPIGLAAALAACTVATAGLSSAQFRGPARGCLAAAVILACPSFVRYAASQCADIALGFYMLAAFVCWSYGRQHRLWLALAGMSAALAAWSKNEGLAFLVVFAVAFACERYLASGRRGVRDMLPLLAGGAPVLVMVLVFKQTLAPPSYFVEEQSLAQALASLVDGDRARLVGSAMAGELWRSGASTVGVVPFLCAFAAIRGLAAPAPPAARAAALAMGMMIAIYSVAYLVTPKDLVWQLQTSLDRLVLQIVPTLAWSIMTITR